MGSLQLNLTASALTVASAAVSVGSFMAVSQIDSATQKIAFSFLAATGVSLALGAMTAWRRSNQTTTLSEYLKNTSQDALFYASGIANLTYENTEKSTKFKVYLLGLVSIGYEYKRS